MIVDQNQFLQKPNELKATDAKRILLGSNLLKYGQKNKGATYFYTRPSFNANKPKFSDDALGFLYDGYTVVYFAMQMATYMGFSEIYLLGVDFSYRNEIDKKGKITSKNTKDYFSDKYQKDRKFANTYKMRQAYKSAYRYSKENDIKIFNATRGGELDVFERIAFDAIKL